VFTPAVTLSDYTKFVQQPMDLGAIMARLREGLYTDPSDWASDVKLIATNAQAYHGSEEPVELRLDWVPGMAADMVNYISDQAKRHEADIKASFSDFSADSLRVVRPGSTAGGENASVEVKTEPAAPPKPLPKLKFSFGKKS
jgi:transcription initiation factor TFIID subunit 1